jgi:hypothetical protein
MGLPEAIAAALKKDVQPISTMQQLWDQEINKAGLQPLGVTENAQTVPNGKSQAKYRNRVCEYDGKKFDSEAERDRYIHLRLLQSAGEIKDLSCQTKFFYCDRDSDGEDTALMFTYIADFSYFRDGNEVFEDVKGIQTPVFRLKKKLIEARHNVKIVLVSKKTGEWIEK